MATGREIDVRHLSAMRPHHAPYNSLDLPDSIADATFKYVIAMVPIVDPYTRYRFAQETEQTWLMEMSEGYFLTTDAMKEGNPFQILQRREEAHMPPPSSSKVAPTKTCRCP